MRIPPRLRKIVDFIDGADTVADIGCDHGLCGYALLKEGRAKKVVACDISEKSLAKARVLARRGGLCSMETRAGDGLSVLAPGEADVIVIAGMGGMQIASILRGGGQVARAAKTLVLLAHRNEYELRAFLAKEGYTIADEALAKERGRFYNIIRAHPGGASAYNDFYLYIGGGLIQSGDPLLKEYLAQKANTLREIIRRAQKGAHTASYRQEMESRLKETEEALHDIADNGKIRGDT